MFSIPYVGVGSTVIAAIKHDRIGYGCDIVQEYIDLAWERVHQFRAGSLRTRPMGKPISSIRRSPMEGIVS